MIHEMIDSRFKCQKCDISYTTQARLNRHLRSKHLMEVGIDERKLSCNLESGVCKEKFRNMKELRKHMKDAHDLKAFLCTETNCGKRFAFKQQCDQHVQKHLGKKSYLCDICQMAFVTSRSLYVHRRVCSFYLAYPLSNSSFVKLHGFVIAHTEIS